MEFGYIVPRLRTEGWVFLDVVVGVSEGGRVERSRETEEARRGGRAVPVKPKPDSVNYEIGRVVYGRGPMYAVPRLLALHSRPLPPQPTGTYRTSSSLLTYDSD